MWIIKVALSEQTVRSFDTGALQTRRAEITLGPRTVKEGSSSYALPADVGGFGLNAYPKDENSGLVRSVASGSFEDSVMRPLEGSKLTS
jgi:hypothetical protein